MLVVDRKVFLHMPRCAGSSVRWAIKKLHPRINFSCEHCHIKVLPQKYYGSHLFFAFTRDPLEWYVSMYFYALANHNRTGKSDPFVYTLSEGFDSFETFFTNALNMPSFYATHPDRLLQLRSRVENIIMNTYNCWLVSYWDDLNDIVPDKLDDSLMKFYANRIGLFKEGYCLNVYRMEEVEQVMKKIFGPEIQLGHRNGNRDRQRMAEYRDRLDLRTRIRISGEPGIHLYEDKYDDTF